jgi:hypothetical protein
MLSYLLVDAMSNFVWVRPLKNKSTQLVTEAFKNVVETSQQKPLILTVDAGMYHVIDALPCYIIYANI